MSESQPEILRLAFLVPSPFVCPVLYLALQMGHPLIITKCYWEGIWGLNAGKNPDKFSIKKLKKN